MVVLSDFCAMINYNELHLKSFFFPQNHKGTFGLSFCLTGTPSPWKAVGVVINHESQLAGVCLRKLFDWCLAGYVIGWDGCYVIGWDGCDVRFIGRTFLAAPVLLQASLSSGLNLMDRAARACVNCRLYNTFTTHVKCSAHKHNMLIINTRCSILCLDNMKLKQIFTLINVCGHTVHYSSKYNDLIKIMMKEKDYITHNP